MEQRLKDALNRFETLCDRWPSGRGTMQKRAPYAYAWQPPQAIPSAKPIVLTLQAITHGNEVGGIPVLITFLEHLASGLIQIPVPLGFVLGNPEAALAGRRYLESDLNRSFSHQSQETKEQRRARELEPMLSESQFFLDLHQTIEPTLSPFFIFPYTPAAYAFAAALHEQLPIVTHWGRPFSKDGMCSDEFVSYKGGVGITLELGQKSFDPYHIGVGLQVALSAVQYAQEHEVLDDPIDPRRSGSLFTWKAIVRYESGMSLNEGLVNFQKLVRGEVIGRHKGDLLAVESGPLLFPKYLRDPLASPPQELYRVLKNIAPHDLGREGVMLE